MSAGGAARRIVANLDCESDFARAAGLSPRHLSAAARAAIAGAGTLLRVFARDGDRLWLPAPVDPGRVPEVPGLPTPVFESGPLADDTAGGVLAWGETAEVSRLRRPLGAALPAEEGLHRLPWRLPPSSPEAAATVNDRRFWLALAEELGFWLPGARVVASPRELTEHLKADGARAAARGGWVLKAPFSAAGRWRYIHPGDDQTIDHRQVEGLFRLHRELVFEPWMERTADFGCAAAVTPGGILELSHHRLLVDRQGRFTGIELRVADCGPVGLHREERDALSRVVEGAGTALARAGYSGPFGVDAWRYRDPDGRETFQPLGEINGRMTFGWVARALVDRLRGPLGLDGRDRARLVFGRGADQKGVPLFSAGKPDGRAIWLEILPSVSARS